MRIETDFIGSMEIPDDALYGIHAARAKENFPNSIPFRREWFAAVALTKLACYLSVKKYKKTLNEKHPDQVLISLMPDEHLEALISAATELAAGQRFEHFIVPAVQGGAGTSINMNINEIIANTALIKLGKRPGMYEIIDPVEHANIFQSTNDVIPTALKVAIMQLLQVLEKSINDLRAGIEKLEQKYRHDLRIAYTQMQEAVPSSFGKLFASYGEMLSRDWWRVSKCFERIKTVNLGGSAIGTACAVPTFFVMDAVHQLRQLTSLPVTRSENLPDATSNLDSFVEVHATLKAHAVNLEKLASDIRLLSSDMTATKEMTIPQAQVGSSIMPGKVNPVITEFVVCCSQKIYANDLLVSSLAAQGCLDLNPYLPMIGHAMIESIELLINADSSLRENMIAGIAVNAHQALEKLYHSPSITTALIPYIGYHRAAELARMMKQDKLDIFKANECLKFLATENLKEALKAERLLKLGYTLRELALKREEP